MYRVGKRFTGGGKLSPVLIGISVFVLAMAVLLCACAIAAGKGSLPPAFFSTAARIAYGAAISAGAFLCAKRAKRAKLLWAALTGGLCLGTVLGLISIFSSNGLGQPAALIGISLGGVILGGILGAKRYQNGYK